MIYNLFLVAPHDVEHCLKLAAIFRVIENEYPLVVKSAFIWKRRALEDEIIIVGIQCNKVNKLGFVFEFECLLGMGLWDHESKYGENEEDYGGIEGDQREHYRYLYYS